MMNFPYYKQYKHEKTGIIGVTYYEGKSIEIIQDGNKTDIRVNDPFFDDREEVIEKDWIDELHNDLFYVGKEVSVSMLREAIEQHAPKQVKFTKDKLDYLKSIATLNDTYVSYNGLIDFLKQHNLLAEDPQGETSE